MSNEIATMNEAVPMPKYNNFVAGFQNALEIVDDVVLKNYISFLPKLEIVPLDEKTLKNNIGERVMLFKITEMVYEKNEFASYKFASVFNTLASINTSFFVLLDSDGFKTDFYMGVRSLDDERTTSSLNKTLRNALIGQFPGIKFKTKDDDDEQGMESVSYTVEDIQTLIDSFKCNSISAVSCVANSKAEHLNTNQQFVQGLEKLVLSMQGQKYTGIIIANTTTQDQLRSLRKEYEKVYTQLSPFASMQVAYGKNENYGKTDTKGTSESSVVSIMMILGGLATLASSDSLIWGIVLVVVGAITIKTKYYVITHRRGSVNIPSDAVDGSEGQEFLDYITKYSPYAVKTDLSLGR